MAANPIESIEHGIVFLMAEWSGAAKLAHDRLMSFLSQRGVGPDRVTCIDIDHEPAICDVAEFSGKVHGWGEAAVVKNGRITFFTILGRDKARIQVRCEELLRAYEA